MKPLEYVIPLAPVSKKNSQRILTNRATGKPFVAQSRAYNDYEAAAAYFLTPRPRLPIRGPVNVRMTFYMPTRRRVDKTNLESCTLDVLVRAGVLADDNRDIVGGTDGTRVLYDKKNPRTEIEITEMDGYEQWKHAD